MVKLLYVHGRAQQGRSEDSIKSEWTQALQEGFQKAGLAVPSFSVSAPFYGDRLYAFTSKEFQERRRKAQDEGVRSLEDVSHDPKFGKFLAEYASQVLDERGNDDRQGLSLDDLVRTQVREPALAIAGASLENNLRGGGSLSDEEERGILNWEPLLSLLRRLDGQNPNFSAFSIELILKDVYEYLTDPNVRDEIDSIVKAQIDNEPTIVIGHSLGSVVAYNILACKTDLCNFALVTVGSPLGIRAVRERLPEAPEYPPNLRSWHNGFDKRDIVALNPLKGQNFLVNAPDTMQEKSEIQNESDNRHSIKGYLSDPWIAKAINEAVTSFS